MAADAQLIGSAGSSGTGTVVSTGGSSAGKTKFLVVIRAFTNTAFDAISGTLTDTFSNTYTQIASTAYDPSGSDAIGFWLCESGTGGASHTAQMVFTTAPFGSTITLYAITGATATSLGSHGTGTATSIPRGTAVTVATGTLAAAPAIIVAAAVSDTSGAGATSWSSTTLTLLESDLGSSPSPVSGAVGKLHVTSTSTITLDMTLNGGSVNANSVIFFASFKEAVAAGAPMLTTLGMGA